MRIYTVFDLIMHRVINNNSQQTNKQTSKKQLGTCYDQRRWFWKGENLKTKRDALKTAKKIKCKQLDNL